MNTNTANLLYWFTIEPYVFVGISSTTVLLYNTLDGNVVESQNSTVLRLMRNLLMKENNGVVGITKEEYSNEGINGFISLVRKYYMGDLIETSLSKSKPIQILPYCSFLDKEDICGNIKYFPYDDILENLFEINIHFPIHLKFGCFRVFCVTASPSANLGSDSVPNCMSCITI